MKKRKKMKRKALFSLLVLILFSFSFTGCSQLPSFGSEDVKTSRTASGFIGGDGLDFKISAPKDKAEINYESGDYVDVVLKLENNGEYTIDGGTVCIFGLDEKVFNIEKCSCNRLPYMEKLKIEDDKIIETEPQDMVILDRSFIDLEEDREFTLSAVARYNYRTWCKVKACVKKDINSKEGCRVAYGKPTEILVKPCSGAPIKVTSVKESLRKGLDEDTVVLLLDIKVQNVGRGNLYDSDFVGMESCISEGENRKIGVTLVDVLGMGEVYCGDVELEKGKGEVRCSLDLDAEDYEPEFKVQLDYGYEIVDSNIFTIKV